MKIKIGILLLSAVLLGACNQNQPVAPEQGSNVVLYEGAVELADKQFGLYYGDRNGNETGVYYVVLSDAMCFRAGFGNPYMDSEGDMLVLEFNGPLAEDELNPRIPDGTYVVGTTKAGESTIDPLKSYVQRFVGHVQSKYEIKSGSVTIGASQSGGYDLYTTDLVISKGGQDYSVRYSYNGDILLEDYMLVAPSQVGLKEDVVDMPFADAEGGYYGNLYGYGTANYMITLNTRGFADDDSNTLPGMMLVLNLFDELPSGDNKKIVITPGTYTVQTYMNAAVGTMLYGLTMSDSSGASSPFGTFFYQITADGQQSVEFIDAGTLKVDHDDDADGDGDYKYTFEYDFTSSAAGRGYRGSWVGEVHVSDLSTDSDRVILSTLEDDVYCDMSKVETATLSKVETLQSTLNTDASPRKDLKTVWQLHLQPRDWTADEKKNYDWDERLEVWTPDGDCMVLEFILPLDSNGEIAPRPNYEYVYTIQPNCSIDSPENAMCCSQMGRPYDDLFHPETAQYWGYANYSWFPKEFDYCNARRGFTWDGWFRGVWYYHLRTGKYFDMDENAPGVFGTVKVIRNGNIYTIVWDLLDDAESPNKIQGQWSGQIKRNVNIG
jgi:hypothetical protein